MASLEGFKEYAVASGDLGDGELLLSLNAAKAYFKNAGVAEPEEENALYDLGVYRLATYYADHRGPSANDGPDTLPYGIQGIIIQLREG